MDPLPSQRRPPETAPATVERSLQTASVDDWLRLLASAGGEVGTLLAAPADEQSRRGYQHTLREIAQRHGSDIATVASAAALEWSSVAAVIVGARNRSHLPANLAISSLALTAEDHARIDLVLAESQELEGDVFGLERDTTGRHGSIMKYNLNKGAA